MNYLEVITDNIVLDHPKQKCVKLVQTKMLKVVLIVSFLDHQNIYKWTA